MLRRLQLDKVTDCLRDEKPFGSEVLDPRNSQPAAPDFVAREFDNASWVGHRLAELPPLPLSIKQSMLEINHSEVRLGVLRTYLRDEDIV